MQQNSIRVYNISVKNKRLKNYYFRYLNISNISFSIILFSSETHSFYSLASSQVNVYLFLLKNTFKLMFSSIRSLFLCKFLLRGLRKVAFETHSTALCSYTNCLSILYFIKPTNSWSKLNLLIFYSNCP